MISAYPKLWSIMFGFLYWAFIRDWPRAWNWFLLDVFTLGFHRGFTIWLNDYEGCRTDDSIGFFYSLYTAFMALEAVALVVLIIYENVVRLWS